VHALVAQEHVRRFLRDLAATRPDILTYLQQFLDTKEAAMLKRVLKGHAK